MPEPLVLAIDVGTSAVKVAAVTPDGTVCGGERLPLQHQSVAAWWKAVRSATNHLLRDARIPRHHIRALSLSGRGGGTVILDKRTRQLVPPGLALADSDDPRVQELDGRARRLRPFASHVLRVLDDEPGLSNRIGYVLAVKDAIALRLTGESSTDPASGPDADRWPSDILSDAGFPVAALPSVRLPWQSAGTLQLGPAARLGVDAGIPVAVGAHDGVAAQIGAGMLRPGDAALTLGTHAVLRMIVAAASIQSRFRFYSLWGPSADRDVYGGNARFGGASAEWLARITGGRGERLLPALEREAASVRPGSDGLLFLPFLEGMLYPERHPEARGAFIGLRSHHERGHLYRAVLEGVAFALRLIDEALQADGVRASRIRLTGGGARSALWPQILAGVLNRQLGLSEAPGFEECVGAARCAWVLLGEFLDLDEAVAAGAAMAATVEPPTHGHRDQLNEAYLHFCAALAALPE